MNNTGPPEEFISALASLRGADVDPTLVFREVPAPRGLAPWAAAVEVETTEKIAEQPVGRSTLVILYDEQQEDIWEGPIRIVGKARMHVDDDQSTDPLLGEVIWSTLLESLVSAGAEPHMCVGTVTREISQTFGGLELRGSSLNADLRCSWTPTRDSLAGDLMGWAEALRRNSGVMPTGVIGIERLNGR